MILALRRRTRRPSFRLPIFLAVLAFASNVAAQLEPQPTRFEEEKPPEKVVLTKPPELLEGAEPILPAEIPEGGFVGDVTLKITIGADGLVQRVEVTGSAGPEMDWAAMGAAANFIFSPAELNGKPGAVAIEYKQVFEVKEVVEVVQTEETAAAEEKAGGDAASGIVNFAGVVREASSKVPLPSVDVIVEVEVEKDAPDFALAEDGIIERKTTTDAEGRFFFRGIPEGRFKVNYVLPGYEPSFIIDEFAPDRRTEAIVYLTPVVANAFETVVRERRARKEVAKVSLTREEVRRIPGTFGDPVRVVENLPGLARAPGFGGALLVRGANPSDTGVYFDGVEIPILYHFGGLTSVVNAEFLDEISFYPGGFSSYYGRATAGIVDVTSRELTMKNFRGYAEVDLIDSGFFFGGPVKIGELPTITFAAAARRSYIDALLPLVFDVIIPAGQQAIVASPIYWDYQLKLESEVLKGQRVSLFAFGSNDDLKVVSSGLGNNQSIDLSVNQAFHRIVARWDARLGNGLRHRFQPYVGVTLLDAGVNSGAGINAVVGSTTYNWGLRDELRWKPNDIFEMAVGLDYAANNFGFELNVPLPLEIGSFPRVYPRLTGENISIQTAGLRNALGFYVEGVFQPFEFVKLVPSIRADATFITAFPDVLPTGETIDGATIALYNVDPRFSGRFDVLSGTTLKGAIGIYRQPPANNQVFPEGGNPNLENPRAVQLIGGIEQELTDLINLDVQLYYTARDRIVQSTNEVVAKGNGEFDPVQFTNGGYGRTFGAEFLLRHEISEYFFGWIAYTLSRSEIDTSESRDRFLLTAFDQTHILTVVGQVNLPYNFTVGGRFRAVSGNPTTLPNGSIHDLDTTDYRRLAQPARASRLPAFHQLDIRVDRKWVFDNFSFTTYLDLLNAYNAQNAEQYQDDYRFREREPIPSLPIIPVIGASGEF